VPPRHATSSAAVLPRHATSSSVRSSQLATSAPRHVRTIQSALPRHPPYAADVIPCHVSPFQWCHVSPRDWSDRTPKTPKLPATCHCLRLPRVLYGPATSPVRNCHVSSYGPDTCPVRTGTCLYGLYGQVQSAKSKFCLFGSADRMRYLPHTDSVCDKNYTTGIRKTSRTSWCWFRRIPSTFIFEHFSCPDGSWIRFLITWTFVFLIELHVVWYARREVDQVLIVASRLPAI
jgi:hypothetical protein